MFLVVKNIFLSVYKIISTKNNNSCSKNLIKFAGISIFFISSLSLPISTKEYLLKINKRYYVYKEISPPK